MSDPRDRVDDPDAPPSDEEVARAEELRAALEDPSRKSGDAELARALGAAWSPRDLTVEGHRALVARALTTRRSRVVRVSFGASAFLALAAGVLLFLWTDAHPLTNTGSAPPGVAMSRSTQGLFTGRFPATGGETSRIDRIAMARGADLRDNEFAKWGIR
jgi:hypothetical protein